MNFKDALDILEIDSKYDELTLQFINKQHIQRIYEQNELIIIELIDYTTLKVKEQNIHVFMERFVK